MNKQKIIKNTIKFVKNKLAGESTGHDWWHTYRVWRMAMKLSKNQKVDFFILELTALLHDIDDWKFVGNNKNSIKKWLLKLKINKNQINKIINNIKSISFKGAGVKSRAKSLEAKIVQDADRLDALGAIGIARAMAFGGYKKRQIYDPKIGPIFHKSFKQYKNSKSTTINHFYEKLLLLKDLMNTETGKKMAEKRHKFLEKYLKEFMAEWKGLK